MSLVKEFSTSSVLGMCVAVAAKKLSRDVMYTVGVAVIGLQALNHFGYVTINWNAIEKDVVRAVDQDGDEKISKEDAMRLMTKFLKVMQKGMPNAAGFTAGFYVGLKLF